ncbi:hypothetical protein LINPERPRIM_LOCUS30187 [Linum perenne]
MVSRSLRELRGFSQLSLEILSLEINPRNQYIRGFFE